MRLFIAIALVLSAQSAFAGDCRYYSRGTAGVTQCEGGYYEERHSNGRVDRWGERNNGVSRYPGSGYDSRYRPSVW